MKIVLANSVGIDSSGWYIIPYHSRWTTSAKGYSDAFTYYPRDLGYLTSLLKRDTTHRVRLLDGCLNRMSKEAYVTLIIAEKPDWLVMESSTRTITDDLWVAELVKKETGAKILLTGQHPSAFAKELSNKCDVVIKGDYLKQARDFFENGAVPPSGGVVDFDPRNLIDVKTLPWPEDEDVSRYDYALKGDPICRYREIQIYASRGCPYDCIYCVARHTYYGTRQYRVRDADDIVAEMRSLFGKYPDCEGLFFDDEIHNANITATKRLARAIVSAGLDGKKYDAMCAYQNFDRESLELMKQAGYYLLRVGIETASDTAASGLMLGGKHRPDKLQPFLESAKDIGLSVYGTFSLGGPGSNQQEDGKTIELMSRLIESDLISDCQISILTPQPGAPFYDWAIKSGAMDEENWNRFDGGVYSVLNLPGYTSSQVEETRRNALIAYDEARRKRDTTMFTANWISQSGRLPEPPKKALIFRSSRDWHMTLCLDAYKKAFPGSELAIMLYRGFAEEYKRKWPWVSPISYPVEGFLNVSGLDENAISSLRTFAPDTAFIPSNVYHCRGYSNVLDIARSVPSIERIYFITSTGEIKPAAR